jgi:hypothetical protein
MKLREISGIVAAAFAIALIQLLAALLGTVPCLIGAVVAGLLAPVTFRFFEVSENTFRLIVTTTISSLVPTAFAFWGSGRATALYWFAPVIAGLACGSVSAIQGIRSRRCELCRRAFGRGLVVECPRCALVVCERCWRFDALRCRLCVDNNVPILPADSRWWDRQFGLRVDRGQCKVCLKSPPEAELRVCRNCTRPQCRNCWDDLNGQCQRCGWVVPDLPEAIARQVMTAAADHTKSRART